MVELPLDRRGVHVGCVERGTRSYPAEVIPTRAAKLTSDRPRSCNGSRPVRPNAVEGTFKLELKV